jgi:ABC-type phosphate/phosphonate transport system substrate-binding protein
VAFVDRESRSGFLCAVTLLEAAGMDPARDLAEVRFAGTHARALALVSACTTSPRTLWYSLAG